MIGRPSQRRLGDGLGLGFVLLLIVGVVVALMLMNNKGQQIQRAKKFREESSPDSLLNRLFIDLSERQDYSGDGWRELLSLMSTDDQRWLRENARVLAGIAPHFETPANTDDTPDARQYLALHYLLDLGTMHPDQRPVVVRIATDPNDSHAVAYIHPPGNLEGLREIFLEREGEAWRVERFLGKRDDPAMLAKLVPAKKAAGAPLTADEQAYARNPAGYALAKRKELLAQVGLSLDDAP